MTIWFMTTNQGKVEEASQYFASHGIEVKQFEFEATEPQADDLEIVALSKIEQAIPHLPNSNDMLLVEDAGLFVDALNGFRCLFILCIEHSRCSWYSQTNGSPQE